jgi:dCTP deaminase
MAFLGKKELEELLPSCIEGYDVKRIDNVAYELCLGNEVYLTDSTSGKKEILDDKNSQVVIKPGQFALLLTQETVKLPASVLAFISIKFSQKIKGLVNISGFHVDPGFNGKIIFSVYNAGPATIVLDKGEPYFMIWLSELTSDSDPYRGSHQNQVKM